MNEEQTTIPTPLVSVCIPTYRGAAHLAATIESVLLQNFSDYELLIIDDNSPDETDGIVASYRDPRIRYLKNPRNFGPEGNWNRCLEEARGRYFKLLPQDDLLYPDTLQKQVETLEADHEKHIALVFGARDIINAAGRKLTQRGCPGCREGRIDGSKLVRRCVRYGTNLIGEPGSVMLRKSLANQIGPFDGSIGYIIDLDYWVRLLAHGDAYYLNQPVSTFRITSGSWSVAIGARQSEEYRRFIARISPQPQWRIGPLDKLAGNLMAGFNNLMRLVFYRMVKLAKPTTRIPQE
jgi:glycosyltransferase involved in cell wall biosynthesis